jgi:hypothetical protein
LLERLIISKKALINEKDNKVGGHPVNNFLLSGYGFTGENTPEKYE